MKTYQVRVYFEDTDCGKIVYHTNYIKYCERARSEIFFANDELPVSGECGFVLKTLNANFIAPASLGDVLEVRSEVLKLKNASISLKQDIYRIFNAANRAKTQELIFSAEVLLAFVNVALGKPSKIPAHIREILQ